MKPNLRGCQKIHLILQQFSLACCSAVRVKKKGTTFGWLLLLTAHFFSCAQQL
jgi:hypothetical protein